MSLILMRYESIKNVNFFFMAQKSGLCKSLTSDALQFKKLICVGIQQRKLVSPLTQSGITQSLQSSLSFADLSFCHIHSL